MDLREKYNDYYIKLINKNINNIIDAFCRFYGEEYRISITKKINSITFTWFRHTFLDKFNDKFKDELDYGKDIEFFLDYPNNYVLGYNKELNPGLLINIMRTLDINCNCIASNTTFYDDDDLIETINLPIFITTDDVIFHEINHVVTKEKLLYYNDEVVFKNGLDINNENIIFDEIINDLTSKEICLLFNRTNGKIFDNNIKVGNDYEKLFPLVESFYIKYRELIKYCRISMNYNMLFKFIDKDIFKKYVRFINKVFLIKKEYDKNNKRFVISKDMINLANNYVKNMDKDNEKKLKLV